MLQLESIEVRYGGLTALDGVSFEVREGEFVSIIGPNGAGKTTLFKAISGIVESVGAMTFEGRSLREVPAAARPHLGIAHVPEGRQVFGSLTVEDNLRLGTKALGARGDAPRNIERIYGLFPILAERRRQLAGTLSGGQQQMLAIGRGLASSPRLLMLDEPSMGLAPAVVDQIFDAVRALHREAGLTILIVEQRAIEAIESCDRGYVIATGKVVASGSRDELLANPQIRSAYLGA
ncbi:ABC transporter ATP-binding protein [Phreatobacter sp. AB_2022a]|uniref:ABC transporter ATP-binding protein n=1 Tax=Phreatobacter sp. AB_2022a TaxID=3003134 RepID=UPI0022875BC6|nr:ABC transporter ATP-binding protein [Phreatobacter sp. AB_2022a]MCZ0732655.1 ABC transporter ATP-binding protein [Phreatobacter sp. AB_2022a]